jgi:phosphopantothenoylcysteine decarboxylase/phosphopantothenate--cysteine ligase
MSLKGKHIIVGISGGIAAYKTLSLIRLLVKNGAEVKTVTTQNALNFVTKLSLQTLSRNNVYSDMFAEIQVSTEHISLSDWADAMIVAPATANIIGKFANGIADDALSTTFLAFNKPVFVAPAMNNKMIENIAVQHNLETLKSRGIHLIEPPCGELACGDEGKGRMEEPEAILERIAGFFLNNVVGAGHALPLQEKKIIITAGPTYEAIDPVRFIGNHSSGLMGICIADEFANQGADVVLVCGPSAIKSKNPNVKRIDVVSAKDMFEVCKQHEHADIIVCSAAVADYAPKHVATQKIKKNAGDSDTSRTSVSDVPVVEVPLARTCSPCQKNDTKSGTDVDVRTSDLTLELVKNPDILGYLGEHKKPNQFLVGFALETENELQNAENKLKSKHLDMLVLNSLNDEGAGFGHQTNKISILFGTDCKSAPAKVKHFELKSKILVAKDIVGEIVGAMHASRLQILA